MYIRIHLILFNHYPYNIAFNQFSTKFSKCMEFAVEPFTKCIHKKLKPKSRYVKGIDWEFESAYMCALRKVMSETVGSPNPSSRRN